MRGGGGRFEKKDEEEYGGGGEAGEQRGGRQFWREANNSGELGGGCERGRFCNRVSVELCVWH